ncbi:hypothetical protein [endosymbiont 'TC1' of Trimyema compressum]|uniref:hypothetical protein n=1 Tax=endosymbiont 'TC1' of Trimyema compressum TaxID=243899 RepID=UPI0013923357|nr:hypothetical protein [endosymbiont 'TC1' of Trimyema compressum]
MSSAFNHSLMYYNTKNNPCRVIGNVKIKNKKEMQFWTVEQFNRFHNVIEKIVATDKK